MEMDGGNNDDDDLSVITITGEPYNTQQSSTQARTDIHPSIWHG